ncbi:MAG TPA: diacylglycerol kinase family protein [Vicinamibacterales bacterium]|nr:diacylglycerol kinase family protein [Vicinamibacterales bacterium]
MARDVAVILNAEAGSASQVVTVEKIVDAFASFHRTAEVRVMPGGAVARAARAAIDEGYAVVAAAGGDGTIGTVASALAASATPLGVLPLGTRNHFAKDLGVPLDLEKAVAAIVTGRVARVDVGEVNGRMFINNSSVGLYPTLVVERERHRRPKRPKWLALGFAIPRVLSRYRWLSVRVDAGGMRRHDRTPFVFIGNNQYKLEGLNIGARARLDSGCLQVCVAPDLRRSDLLRAIGAALVGRLSRSGAVEMFLTSGCVIEASRRELLVTFDGEVARLTTPLVYRAHPRALSVIVPH